MLYLASTRNLTVQQKAFLAHTQGKLNSDELQRALRIYSALCSDERFRARLRVQQATVPAELSPPRPKEPRRIGIGYRDKGSLRPPHRPSLPGEVTVSSEQEGLLRQQFGFVPTEVLEGQRLTSDQFGLRFARSLQPDQRSDLLRGNYQEGGYPLPTQEPPTPVGKPPNNVHQLDRDSIPWIRDPSGTGRLITIGELIRRALNQAKNDAVWE